MSQLHPQLAKDCLPLGQFPLCQLLLMNDSHYPWFILVPKRENVQEIYQLKPADQQQLMRESSAFGEMIMALFQGDKLNIGALGNVVPQLHLHHIVRFRNDPAWPAPVWGKLAATPYDEAALQKLLNRLKEREVEELTWHI